MSDNTIPFINALVGKSIREIQQMSFFYHCSLKLRETENSGIVEASVEYRGNQEYFPLPAILAVFLVKQVERVNAVYPGSPINLSFARPHGYSSRIKQSITEACVIAGINYNVIHFTDRADCLAHTYSKKLQGIKLPEKSHLMVLALLLSSILYIS
jgi:hypothetical protein